MAIQTISDLQALLQRISDWMTQGQAIQADLNSALSNLTNAQTANSLAAKDVIKNINQLMLQWGFNPPAQPPN